MKILIYNDLKVTFKSLNFIITFTLIFLASGYYFFAEQSMNSTQKSDIFIRNQATAESTKELLLFEGYITGPSADEVKNEIMKIDFKSDMDLDNQLKNQSRLYYIWFNTMYNGLSENTISDKLRDFYNQIDRNDELNIKDKAYIYTAPPFSLYRIGLESQRLISTTEGSNDYIIQSEVTGFYLLIQVFKHFYTVYLLVILFVIYENIIRDFKEQTMKNILLTCSAIKWTASKIISSLLISIILLLPIFLISLVTNYQTLFDYVVRNAQSFKSIYEYITMNYNRLNFGVSFINLSGSPDINSSIPLFPIEWISLYRIIIEIIIFHLTNVFSLTVVMIFIKFVSKTFRYFIISAAIIIIFILSRLWTDLLILIQNINTIDIILNGFFMNFIEYSLYMLIFSFLVISCICLLTKKGGKFYDKIILEKL